MPFGEISRKWPADPEEKDGPGELIVPTLKKRKMWLKQEEQERDTRKIPHRDGDTGTMPGLLGGLQKDNVAL